MSLYSPSWYRVAGLRPRLRAHVQIHRHVYRGGVWYVVQDNQTGRFHRLSMPAYQVVCLLNGERSVEEIWNLSAKLLGGQQPTQTEIVSLLSLLHNADLILGGVEPHMDELDARARKQARNNLLSRIKNPMALRIRLLDPDRFLTATLPLVRPLFSLWGLCGWALLVLAGLVLFTVNAAAVAASHFEQILTAQNILIVLLIYPVVKALHEMGHAYANKVWGGEVHELGVMVLVFVPVPYVDASSSAAFRDKRLRALVGAAGILVELALAALAMIVWLLVEPGLIRAIAFNVMMICGVSTLLFNGNPLLRFDGYYVLCDLLEIPNLAQRANAYVVHLAQRYAFQIPDLTTPASGPGEERWFVIYAVTSFLYRLSVSLGIALYIGTHFFFVGVGLALITVVSVLVLPLVKFIKFLLFDMRLHGRRRRALGVSATAATALVFVLLVVPLPYATMAEGVVWVGDEEASVRARSDGIVVNLPTRPDALVSSGAVLVSMEDPILAARAQVVQRQLEELQLRYDTANFTDRVLSNILREQIRNVQGQLDDMRRSLAELNVRAPRPGRFLPLDASDLPGRFQHRGDLIGYVVGEEGPVVRAVVPQAEIDLVRRRTQSVSVRLVTDTATTLSALSTREVPAAVSELPHAALATQGGGEILVDASNPDKLKPLDSVFQIDIRLADLPPQARLGTRAYVRFEHPAEPIGLRLARLVRQVFLRQFNV